MLVTALVSQAHQAMREGDSRRAANKMSVVADKVLELVDAGSSTPDTALQGELVEHGCAQLLSDVFALAVDARSFAIIEPACLSLSCLLRCHASNVEALLRSGGEEFVFALLAALHDSVPDAAREAVLQR